MLRILLILVAAAGLMAAVAVGWRLGAPPEPVHLAATAVPATPAAELPPSTLTIKSERRGAHHIVTVTIAGRNGIAMTLPLTVDTGASVVALPASLIGRLGYKEGDLRDDMVRTANGQVKVKAGKLASLELGGPDNNQVIANVDAIFVDDSALGTQALLGMNVLGRYTMTIDDANDRIILAPKR